MKISRDKLMLLLLVILTALILAACGASGEADQTPGNSEDLVTTPTSETPVSGAPPEAKLVINGLSQVSGIGTYCWPDATGDASICADKIGVPTAQDPLAGETPIMARFEFPLSAPSELQLLAVPVNPEDELEESAEGFRWWEPNSGEPYQLSLENSPEIELSLDAGLYVLRVFARWEGVGDVLYGFLVEVTSDQVVGPETQETNVTAIEILQDELPVRSGAGEAFSSVATAFRGQTWNVTGLDATGEWWQLSCALENAGQALECWVPADPGVTSISDPGLGATLTRPALGVSQVTVQALAGLNLRAGPALTNEVVSILISGETVQVTGVTEDGSWWRVRCPDGSVGECWISADPLLSQPVGGG